jgi:hypothetical protein
MGRGRRTSEPARDNATARPATALGSSAERPLLARVAGDRAEIQTERLTNALWLGAFLVPGQEDRR